MTTRLEHQLQNVHLCQGWMAEHGVDRADQIPYGATVQVDGTSVELGRKIARARESYRLGRLHPDAVLAYEQLPGWSWKAVAQHRHPGPPRTTASVLPDRVRAWMLLHGAESADQIPHSAVLDVDGRQYTLGNQLARMRRLYAAGKLVPEQIKALEQLPDWQWTPPRQRPLGRRKRFAPN